MATSDTKNDSNHRPDSNHREDSYGGVNDGGMVVFILSMVVTFAMFIYVAFFSGGIDLKEIKPAGAPAAATAPAADAAPASAPAGEAAPAGTAEKAAEAKGAEAAPAAKDPGQK